MKPQTKLKILCLLYLFFSIISFTCSKNSSVQPEELSKQTDYFPFSKNYRWLYTSNALSDSGKEVTQFEMKLDTVTYAQGNFWSMLIRLSDSKQWYHIRALKDSGNIVYSLGDFANSDQVPAFKHIYAENETISETLNIAGRQYITVKYKIISDTDTLSLWFADGVGLVKEYSRQGLSVFNDDLYYYNIPVTTELVSYSK